jgi:hypothetical protein
MMNKIAKAIEQFSGKYRERYGTNNYQQQLFNDIGQCRTPALGGHVMACTECGSVKATYNSCNNRHCPNCGSYKREKWILYRKAEALPVKYFHVVFTLPCEFNILCIQNPALVYDNLFKAAWHAILTMGKDHKYLGAKTGMIAVLHTWGQNLSLHPHLHCLVPAGGFTKGQKWRPLKKSSGKYLFPVKALGQLFKAKFCNLVSKQITTRKLKPPEDVANPYNWLNSIYTKKWVVYAKKPVEKGGPVVEYLGRYAHKVAIGNSRIKNVGNNKVSFSWFDYKTSKPGVTTLDGVEFVRRFLLHLLPKGFVKVRYMGFMANRGKKQALRAILQDLGILPEKSLKGLP